MSRLPVDFGGGVSHFGIHRRGKFGDSDHAGHDRRIAAEKGAAYAPCHILEQAEGTAISFLTISAATE